MGRKNDDDTLAILSFIAILLLGLALMLGMVFGWIGNMNGFRGWIERIALAIAIVVPLILSGRYAIRRWRDRSRSGTVWFVLWIIAVILVVVFYVLGFFWRWW